MLRPHSPQKASDIYWAFSWFYVYTFPVSMVRIIHSTLPPTYTYGWVRSEWLGYISQANVIAISRYSVCKGIISRRNRTEPSFGNVPFRLRDVVKKDVMSIYFRGEYNLQWIRLATPCKKGLRLMILYFGRWAFPEAHSVYYQYLLR